MKRSKHIALVVLGTASVLAACSDGESAVAQQELKQDYYTTKEECEKDWGIEVQDCKPTAGLANGLDSSNTDTAATATATGSHIYSTPGSRYLYAGPRYYWNREIGRPVAVSTNGQSHVVSHGAMGAGHASSGKSVAAGSVSRGGFGSTAHSGSSGG